MKQRSIRNSIKASGLGLHTGQNVNITFRPAPVDTGVVFIRTDLPEPLQVPATGLNVCDTTMCTVIGAGTDIQIGTIEHLMSALYGLSIDNIYIDIDNQELPILDGSAAPFVFLLQSAGIEEQEAPKKFIKIIKPIEVVDGDKIAKFMPYNGFKLGFEINFDHPVISLYPQKVDLVFSSMTYIKEVSRARTFGFLKDLEYLRQHNLARGGSLENAVVVDETKILNKDGLRYKDEFVKHKILDAIGDLYLAQASIIGEYFGYKSGHALNNKLVRKLLANKDSWEYIEFADDSQVPVDFLEV